MMLPLIAPKIPETTNAGLLVLLATILAVPKVENWGGKLTSETLEFGGQEKPAPRNVMVHVETSLAFLKVTNSMTFSWTSETDAIGVDSETRFAAAQVVTKLYLKFGWKLNWWANTEDF